MKPTPNDYEAIARAADAIDPSHGQAVENLVDALQPCFPDMTSGVIRAGVKRADRKRYQAATDRLKSRTRTQADRHER